MGIAKVTVTGGEILRSGWISDLLRMFPELPAHEEEELAARFRELDNFDLLVAWILKIPDDYFDEWRRQVLVKMTSGSDEKTV